MRPLIIGIGNDLRGDDGVGLEAARRLTTATPTEWDICEASDDALALMEMWQGREAVIIIDAAQADGTPGTITRLDPTTGPLNTIMNDVSSHGLGLGHSLELARSLAKLPEYCVVFVVEGYDFSMGKGLSPEVEQAVPQVMSQVGREAEKLAIDQTMKRGSPDA
jgi:hydrogenase maturation protease